MTEPTSIRWAFGCISSVIRAIDEGASHSSRLHAKASSSPNTASPAEGVLIAGGVAGATTIESFYLDRTETTGELQLFGDDHPAP